MSLSGLFDKLLGKSVTAKKSVGRTGKAVAGKSGAKPKRVQTASSPAPGAVPRKLASVVARKDELPRFDSVLSVSGSPLVLAPEQQALYVIALAHRDKKDVYVFCSSETVTGGIDDDFMAIDDQIQRQGFNRLKKVVIKHEIISILNEESRKQVSYEDHARQATKIQLEFDALLRAAVEKDISDIHIEIRRESAFVRFRKHGDLYEHAEWSVSYARTLTSVIYNVIADVKDTTFDPDRPQDALVERDLGEEMRLTVRLATLPAHPDGYDVTMRIQRNGYEGQVKSLEELGYEPLQLALIRRASAKPVGALFMAGTTGSGKSTTINSQLSEKIKYHRGSIKVITVEDPPEFYLKSATQVPVNRSRALAKENAADSGDNPFAPYIRAAMRNDPDIIMVGEVRDAVTAELLVHAVQSGHPVYTTVHASGGIDIISRLRSNGISNAVLGSQNFISALMYQTLLQVLCPHCCVRYEAIKAEAESELENDFIWRVENLLKPEVIPALRFRNESGCDHEDCSRGVIGRTVAAECILPDSRMLKLFREGREVDAFIHYRKIGGKIALEHGVLKAFRGIVDLRTVELALDQVTSLKELDDTLRFESGLQPDPEFRIGFDVFDSKSSLSMPPITGSSSESTQSALEPSQAFATTASATATTVISEAAPETIVEPQVDGYVHSPALEPVSEPSLESQSISDAEDNFHEIGAELELDGPPTLLDEESEQGSGSFSEAAVDVGGFESDAPSGDLSSDLTDQLVSAVEDADGDPLESPGIDESQLWDFPEPAVDGFDSELLNENAPLKKENNVVNLSLITDSSTGDDDNGGFA